MLADEPGALGFRQFRHGCLDGRDKLVINDYGQQVWLGEVTIIVGDFLAAHGAGFIEFGIIQAGLLNDTAAVFNQVDLPFNFVVDGFFNKTERVDVLDFSPGTELGLAFFAHGYVGITTHGTLRHVAIRNTQVEDDGVQFFQIGNSLFGVAQIWLGDDLEQWCASTVQVDTGHVLEIFVERLSGIFFDMRTRDADDFFTTVFQFYTQ